MKLDDFYSKTWEWGCFKENKNVFKFYDKNLTISIRRSIGLEFDITVTKFNLHFSFTFLRFNINGGYIFNKKPFFEGKECY